MNNLINRRTALAAGTTALAFGATTVRSAAITRKPARPPLFTYSVNLELMFPQVMPRGDRIRAVAATGVKAFGFSMPDSAEEETDMLRAQDQTGLACAIVNGSGSRPNTRGGTTGLVVPGFEAEYLEEVRICFERGRRFGASCANTFVGAFQPEVPWLEQRRRIVEGLKRAADIARRNDIVLTLEPLPNRKSAICLAEEAYSIVDQLADPHVRMCFDFFCLQQSQGNLTNNLKLGLKNGWIKIVQSGQVPFRTEPGTGEIDHKYLFGILKDMKYAGYVDAEHGTTTTSVEAIALEMRLIAEA